MKNRKNYDNLIIPFIIPPSSELSKPYISKVIKNPEDYYRMYNLNLNIIFDEFLPTPNELRRLIIDFNLIELRNFSVQYYDFFESDTIQDIQFKKLSKEIQSGASEEKIYISSRPTILFFPDLDYLSIKMLLDVKCTLSIWIRTGKNKNSSYTFVREYKDIDNFNVMSRESEHVNLFHLMKTHILPSYFQIQKNKEIESLDNLIIEYFKENNFHK